MKFILLYFILGFIICDELDVNANITTYSPLRFKYGNQTINKPLFHFTPDYGWMNDPNGCWYDNINKVFHLYFQYNPANTIWDMPLYWGHATSKNLLLWKQQDIAIQPIDKKSGAYSGSIFIDDNLTDSSFSLFFREIDENNKFDNNNHKVIAAWTYTEAAFFDTWYEYQYLSYSYNNGYTFRTPNESTLTDFTNPVADEEGITKEYRDPQVIKVAKNVYVMSVAKAHEYQILFYKSDNEPKFTKFGKFGLIGYLGYQYECPNLVHLECPDCKTEANANDEEKEEEIYTEKSYWVLFISINPGSIQGGSSTQYFIGEFNYKADDSKPFTVLNHRTTVIDYGKDFYAMQLFFQIPELDTSSEAKPFKKALGVGWASNWQYTQLVPTDPWRSSMSIPREIKLKFYQPADKNVDPSLKDPSPKLLYVAQRPFLDDTIFDSSYNEIKLFKYYENGQEKDFDPNKEEGAVPKAGYLYHADLSKGAFGALEFELEYGIYDSYTNDIPGVLTLYLNGTSIPGEYLRIGHNNKADAFFIDRGHTNVQWCHENPFFTDKVSVNIYKKELREIIEENPKTEAKKYYQMFSVHGIIDRNIIELFFNEDDKGYSIITSTNTFFFTGGNFIDSIDLKVNNDPTGDNEYGYIITKFNAKQLNPDPKSSFETVVEIKNDEEDSGRLLKETDL